MGAVRKRIERSGGRHRGAVLLLVLAAVAVLTLLAVEVSHRAKLDVLEASRLSRDLAFKRGFDSGVELARGMLVELRSKEGYDHAGGKWAEPVEIVLSGETTIRVSITDEASKLKIGGTAEQGGADAVAGNRSMARLFHYLAKHDSEREEQWKEAEKLVRKRLGIPEKDETKKNANQDTPSQANPEGAARTPPLLTVDGLREAGLPTELVFGDLSNNDGEQKNTRKKVALCEVLTTFGDGKVNLNTAHPAVLSALDEEYDEALVAAIESWRGRTGTDSDKNSGKPFKSAKELELVPGVVIEDLSNGQRQVTKNLFTKVQERVTVQSRWFSARIELRHRERLRVGWAYFEVLSAVAPDGPQAPAVKLLAFEEYEL